MPWWTLLGPAFVWAATAQGSGELIWWPYLVARYGEAFLFLLLPAALIQFFVNREIAKYTTITGQGIWKGFVSLGRWFAIPLFLLCFVNFLWLGGYASSGGSSLHEIFKWPFADQRTDSLFWSYVLIALFSTGIIFSKVIYNFIERIMKVVTVITLGGLIVSILIVVKGDSLINFVTALFNPTWLGKGVSWEGFDYSQLITGLVFAGMGGFLNLMYSYWMKDKGVGMANFSHKISGVTVKDKEGEEETDDEVLKFEDNQQNQESFKKWMQYLNIDSGLAVALNAVTIILTSLLAYVLLWPKRSYPEGWSITVAQSSFFEASFGAIGKVMFLMVAAAFLVDTWVSLVDGVSRQYADFARSISQKARKWSTKKWYYFWLVFQIVVTVVTILMASPAVLLKLTGVVSMLAFVFYLPAIWYLNYIKLPSEYPSFVKSGWLSQLSLVGVWLIYTGLAGWYLWRII
jgi:Mn2+/Fe2+ NRAMP family transporter